jgi:hypothetical protein
VGQGSGIRSKDAAIGLDFVGASGLPINGKAASSLPQQLEAVVDLLLLRLGGIPAKGQGEGGKSGGKALAVTTHGSREEAKRAAHAAHVEAKMLRKQLHGEGGNRVGGAGATPSWRQRVRQERLGMQSR